MKNPQEGRPGKETLLGAAKLPHEYMFPVELPLPDREILFPSLAKALLLAQHRTFSETSIENSENINPQLKTAMIFLCLEHKHKPSLISKSFEETD